MNEADGARPGRGWGGFEPLRERTFRTIWSASLLSNFGQLIQGVGAAWEMTRLTSTAEPENARAAAQCDKRATERRGERQACERHSPRARDEFERWTEHTAKMVEAWLQALLFRLYL